MLYFAYGSNLNLDHMRRLCPGARVVSRAVLLGHRLVFPRPDSLWRGGVAGLEPDEKAHVEGALYEITEADVVALDEYEGVAEGDYFQKQVTVWLPTDRSVEAMTYFATAIIGGPFQPSEDYLQTILNGAREHGLSESWLAHLGRLRLRETVLLP